MMKKQPRVLIALGNDSDKPLLEACVKTLTDFGVAANVTVCSADRTPEHVADLTNKAEADGMDVIIAASEKWAELPVMLAASTVLPVIGIPIKSSTLDGLQALLSSIDIPTDIPVATVAVNGSENAALLAIQIMGGIYPELRSRIHDFKNQMAEMVAIKDKQLQEKLRGI